MNSNSAKVVGYTYDAWGNCSIVKKGYHKVLHTIVYYKILNYSMITSYVINGRDGVVWLLRTYQNVLGNL